MVANPKTRFITPEEYLERESAAETKSEYHGGVILAMSGASPEHVRITFDIGRRLGNQLEGTKCEPFANDMRVYVAACNCYFYPDIVAACDGSRFQRLAGVSTLENPTLIVEVLSPSTENTDRGEKLICYQTLESLATYLIVSQDRPMVQAYERQPEGPWHYSVYQGLDAAVPLPAIGCQLRLAEAYARVEFPAAEERRQEPADP